MGTRAPGHNNYLATAAFHEATTEHRSGTFIHKVYRTGRCITLGGGQWAFSRNGGRSSPCPPWPSLVVVQYRGHQPLCERGAHKFAECMADVEKALLIFGEAHLFANFGDAHYNSRPFER